MKIKDFQQFSGYSTIENGFTAAQRFLPLFYFYFYFQKGDFIMLLSDLLQVVNTRNYLHIYVMSTMGTYYDTIYMSKLETRSEAERLIKKYGKRKVTEIDTHTENGQHIFIEVER